MNKLIIIIILAIFIYSYYTNKKIKRLENELKQNELEMRIQILEDKFEKLKKDKN